MIIRVMSSPEVSQWFRRVSSLLLAGCCALLSPRAAGAGSDGYVEGDALVKFRPGVPRAQAARAIQAQGLVRRREYAWLGARNARTYVHLHSDTLTTAELLDLLRADPRVEYASPNHLARLDQAFYPNDALFTNQWALHNTGQTVGASAGVADADIDAPEAWRLQGEPTGLVVIAVMDSGVYYAHQDLSAAIWTNPGEIPDNGADDDGNGYTNDVHGYDFSGDGLRPPDSCPMDVGTHGTHVSGIAAGAMQNGAGIAGVSPARIMALKCSTNGIAIDDASQLEALQYAVMMKTRGVPIAAINCSFGGGSSNAMLHDAYAAAGEAGIVVCAAAGNGGALNNDATPQYPASYALGNILAVAATDSSDRLASFSHYGSNSVDLAAPGAGILSCAAMSSNGIPGTLSVQGTASNYPLQAFLFGGATTGLTALAVNCGVGYATNFAGMAGRIAVLKRSGAIAYTNQVRHAMQAGCIAAVVYNFSGNDFITDATLVYPEDWIPVANMKFWDGKALTSQVPAMVTLKLEAPYLYQDGTSMACPLVAGAVAALALQFPGDAVTQRMARLLAAVDVKTNLAGRVATGGRLNLRRAMDADEDGIGDWWEQAFFGSLAAASNAVSDADGDGSTDYAEFMAGTVPTNPASRFELTDARFSSSTGFALQWPGVAGRRSYAVARAANASGPFAHLTSGIPPSPPTNSYVDAGATNASRSFYRLVAE